MGFDGQADLFVDGCVNYYIKKAGAGLPLARQLDLDFLKTPVLSKREIQGALGPVFYPHFDAEAF